jgi:glycerol-3-phosphate dehydrogenase (NAD(P)+)
MSHISIIGAGSWGTALSLVIGQNGHDVKLWTRSSILVDEINKDRINKLYLPTSTLPDNVRATSDLAEALHQSDIIILVTPSHVVREIAGRIASYIDQNAILVSATKGFETESGKRVSEVLYEILSNQVALRFVALSGPSFAREVAAGYPTAIVAASENLEAARKIQSVISNQNLRIYTNQDVVGVEIGGAVKNVIALASGMVKGLGLGANSVAALVTRGLSEISRFALRQGAHLETLMGLAGLGDLVLTCTSDLSRNHQVGQALAQGSNLNEITGMMHEVAEGIRTTKAAKMLSQRLQVEMPITDEVYAVLYENKKASDAIRDLMMRPLREE